jgi:eukaryotic-like serine/threonine-protein kinase
VTSATLRSGTRLGPYEITTPLGSGGMGEVYRARDTRLDRSVAIKVLGPDVAGDAGSRSRFEREARAIAALSHPHICTLHDVGEHEGTAYLVMELLEGQTLAARLEKGALPLDQALKVVGEIADALDKAHRQGIVHRDLKPANVMLTKTGAKLLDFGLAKLRPAATPVTLSGIQGGASTTIDTARGTILGTVQYMAPEQVEGREADARSDIWALGAVLYEMVTGVRPFTGDTPASVIGAILKDTPTALSKRQPVVPSLLDSVVNCCLEKDPEARWQSAADVAQLLQLVTRETTAPLATAAQAGSSLVARWLPAAVAVVSLTALGVTLWVRDRPQTTSASLPLRIEVKAGAGVSLVTDQGPAIALSPGGTTVAFVARKSGQGRQLYLRRLDQLEPTPLPSTDGADPLLLSGWRVDRVLR